MAACPAFRNFAPRAKRVIYLFQSGGPSQMDLFDYKPELAELRATELPDSIRMGQRLTGMTSAPNEFSRRPLELPLRSARPIAARGSANCCRTRPSMADELCFIKSMHTEAINHDPAVTFFQTGAPARRPAQHRLVACLRPGERERTICRRSWS